MCRIAQALLSLPDIHSKAQQAPLSLSDVQSEAREPLSARPRRKASRPCQHLSRLNAAAEEKIPDGQPFFALELHLGQ